MRRKRGPYSGAVQARVGLEAMTGVKTVAQLARAYPGHPRRVGPWTATIRERLPELFAPGRLVSEESERKLAALHEQIGELIVSLDGLNECRHVGRSLPDARWTTGSSSGWGGTKYEGSYRQDYGGGWAAGRGLDQWFIHYNTQRPHQFPGERPAGSVVLLAGGRARRFSAPPWDAMKPPSPARRGRTAGTARLIEARRVPEGF